MFVHSVDSWDRTCVATDGSNHGPADFDNIPLDNFDDGHHLTAKMMVVIKNL
jgi:hypothetical protein